MADQSWADFFQNFEMPQALEPQPDRMQGDPNVGGDPMLPDALSQHLRSQQPQQPQQPQDAYGMSKFLMGRRPANQPDDPGWAGRVVGPMGQQHMGMADPLIGSEHQGQTRQYNPFGGVHTDPGFNSGQVQPPYLKRERLPGNIDMYSPNQIPLPQLSRPFR